jgi:hypothetical protein
MRWCAVCSYMKERKYQSGEPLHCNQRYTHGGGGGVLLISSFILFFHSLVFVKTKKHIAQIARIYKCICFTSYIYVIFKVREFDKLLSEYLSDGCTLSGSFAKLETVVLLLNLDRPSDVSFYPINQHVMTASEMRAVLSCRFGETASSQVKFPFETAVATH